jgi:hypothetical protein
MAAGHQKFSEHLHEQLEKVRKMDYQQRARAIKEQQQRWLRERQVEKEREEAQRELQLQEGASSSWRAAHTPGQIQMLI